MVRKTPPGRLRGRDGGDIQVQQQFGISPRSSSGQVNVLRQRRVERLCLTPRLVLELLCELGRYHGIVDDIDARLERFAGLDPVTLRALGADRFPPSIFLVGGER
jgi:hypothetical protein